MHMRLVHAPMPTGSIWEILERALLAEPHILGSRITATKLRELYDEGLAVVGFYEERLVGFIAAWPVSADHVEVGSAWIHIEHRGVGFGTQLVAKMADLLREQKKSGFAISDNPAFIATTRKVHLPLHNEWKSPIPYELTCGPCEKFPNDEMKDACPYRNNACRLILFNS